MSLYFSFSVLHFSSFVVRFIEPHFFFLHIAVFRYTAVARRFSSLVFADILSRQRPPPPPYALRCRRAAMMPLPSARVFFIHADTILRHIYALLIATEERHRDYAMYYVTAMPLPYHRCHSRRLHAIQRRAAADRSPILRLFTLHYLTEFQLPRRAACLRVLQLIIFLFRIY
jgi:hypothetical protein